LAILVHSFSAEGIPPISVGIFVGLKCLRIYHH